MRRLALLLVLLLSAVGAIRAAEVPIPPAPARWVTDTAGFLSPGAAQRLDGELEAYERATGHQLIVWIGATTGDTPTEEWTIKAFEKWKVGRKGLDDGLVLFVFPQDRKVRIEVGYGLEDVVPDAIASRIIYDGMIPLIQKGENDAAVEGGVKALIAVTGGQAGSGEVSPQDDAARLRQAAEPMQHLSLGQMILLGILAIAFLILLVTHPGLALWLLFSILSGGRGGGGGGFSGGGGGGGGGGATGSW
jgi:uncharacterized protein